MKTILIVEDETILRSAYASILSAEGYKVLEAGDGHQALEHLKKTTPDLILLDILMPVMNGYEFLEKSKLANKTDVKIIAFSNLSDQQKLRDVLKSSTTKHVLKSSLSPKELAATIHEMLESDK
jgi:CheY-like chemotaxis protein